MESKIHPPVSKGKLWAGRIMSWLPALFLLVDGVMKLFKPAVVVEATVKLGYPENTILPIGIVLTVCTILYLIPRTAVLGAILLTGYLGGAVATHVRVRLSSACSFGAAFTCAIIACAHSFQSIRKETDDEHCPLDYSDTACLTLSFCRWDEAVFLVRGFSGNGTTEPGSLAGSVPQVYWRV